MSALAFALVLAAIAIPILGYVKEGWSAADKNVGPGFFVAGRSISIRDYRVTTVAYGLQMAAVVLFAQWGYYHGFWAFVVPLAWAGGFLLLALLTPQLERFLAASLTLHGYVGRSVGGSAAFIRIAALATVLGLGGALFAELRYVATAIQGTVGAPDNLAMRNALMALFLLACLAYTMPAGFRAVVSTDRRQLPLGYFGLAAVLASLIYIVGAKFSPITSAVPLTIGGLSFSIILTVVLIAEPGVSRPPVREWLVPLICCMALVVAHFTSRFSSGPSVPLATAPWQPVTMPWLTVAGLLVANGLWQLVDLSAFQRLSALQPDVDQQQRTNTLRRAVMWTALESPVSWCVGIAIGMALGQLGEFGGADGAWTALETYLRALATGQGGTSLLPEWARLAALALGVAALVAVALSTIDSIGSAISLTTTADIVGHGDSVESASLHTARLVTVGTIAAVFALGLGWERWVTGDLASWLYVAYSMQLSLLGSVVVTFAGRTLRTGSAMTSVAAGLVLSAGIGAWLTLGGRPEAYSVPPMVAAAASTVIAWLMAKRTVTATPTPREVAWTEH